MSGVNFPIITRNRTVDGWTFETEGVWTGPFYFVQCTDTQFGMIDNFHHNNKDNPSSIFEIQLCEEMIKKINAVQPLPRFVIVCGDLVDASPPSMRQSQVADFKRTFSKLDSRIKLLCVAGNHDITDDPTEADVELYKKEFGDDFYSFWVGGVKFVVINSQYYFGDQKCETMKKQHEEWLTKELQPTNDKPFKHLIGFQHIPPFVKSPSEARVPVFNHEKLSFNFPNPTQRREYLNQLKQSKMSKLFCGHYHRNAGGWDETLEVVVTTSMGCQLADDYPGFRVVKVLEKSVNHSFYRLQPAQSHISYYA